MKFSDYEGQSTTSDCRPGAHVGPWEMEGAVYDPEFGAVASVRCNACGAISVGVDPAPPKTTEAT